MSLIFQYLEVTVPPLRQGGSNPLLFQLKCIRVMLWWSSAVDSSRHVFKLNIGWADASWCTKIYPKLSNILTSQWVEFNIWSLEEKSNMYIVHAGIKASNFSLAWVLTLVWTNLKIFKECNRLGILAYQWKNLWYAHLCLQTK